MESSAQLDANAQAFAPAQVCNKPTFKIAIPAIRGSVHFSQVTQLPQLTYDTITFAALAMPPNMGAMVTDCNTGMKVMYTSQMLRDRQTLAFFQSTSSCSHCRFLRLG
jgi:hypothetical protein